MKAREAGTICSTYEARWSISRVLPTYFVKILPIRTSKNIKVGILLIKNDLKTPNLRQSKHNQKPQTRHPIPTATPLQQEPNPTQFHTFACHCTTHLSKINLLYLSSLAQIALHIITHSSALALGFNSLSSQKLNSAPYWQIQESSLAIRQFHFTATNPSIPHHFEISTSMT